MAEVLCSIFDKFKLVEAKSDSILVEDDADTFQVEENEHFFVAV